MEAGDLKEAWRCLKGWYSTATNKAPKPCYSSMKKQTEEREELYRKVAPPGDPIPINVEPFDIDDSVPEDAAIREVVAGMQNGREGGSGGSRPNTLRSGFKVPGRRRRTAMKGQAIYGVCLSD